MALETDRYGSRADTLIFLICVALSLAAMALPPGARDSLAGGIRRTVLAPLLALQEQSIQFQTSRARFIELERQRDSAALAATFLPTLRAENERLRGLLGLRERVAGAYVPAEVLHQAEPTSPLVLVIRAGRRHGVRALAPVVGPEGLLGSVAAVDPGTSTVITWAHPDFRASAMAADGSVYGIVAPASGVGPRGSWMLELRGVPYRDAVVPGTLIVTAGLGGVLPRGIPIGVVVGTAGVERGWERSYLVRPLAQPSGVSHAIVLVAPTDADVGPAFGSREAGP